MQSGEIYIFLLIKLIIDIRQLVPSVQYWKCELGISISIPGKRVTFYLI